MKDGYQFELDAWPKFGGEFYGYCNIGFSSSSLFPEYRIGGELYANLPKSFEASLGFRYMDFGSSDVPIFTGTVGKYYGNYWFSFRPFITVKSSGTSASGNLLIRKYFATAEDYITLTIGAGSSPGDLTTLAEIDRQDSFKFGLDWNKELAKVYIIGLSGKFEREEYEVSEWGDIYSFSAKIKRLW
jgi:YaiO family outer membrane protein